MASILRIQERAIEIEQLFARYTKPLLIERPLRGPVSSIEFESAHIRRLEEQAGRFRVWANNVGVYAGKQACLDYRLRNANDVADIIVYLLDDLALQLQDFDDVGAYSPHEKLADTVSSSLHPTVQHIHIPERFITAVSTSRGTNPAKELDIKQCITRLHILGLAIRRAGSSDLLSRTNDVAMYDDITRDSSSKTEPFVVNFEGYLATRLEHQFRKVSEPLRGHLSRVFAARRRRFYYAQTHLRKLSQRRVASPTPRENTPAQSVQPTPTSDASPREVSVTLQETRASTFHPTKFTVDLEPSVSSSQVSVSRATLNYSGIPPAPTVGDVELEHVCPYCCWILPTRTFRSKRKWTQHLEQDLQPYVCIHEACFNAPKMYASFDEWVEHSNSAHHKTWFCHECVESSNPEPTDAHTFRKEIAVFDDKETFWDHRRNTPGHEVPITTHEVGHRHYRPRSPLVFNHCPFCDWLPSDQSSATWTTTQDEIKSTQQHIANHLLTISMWALPWRDDESATQEQLSSDLAGSDSAVMSYQRLFAHSSVDTPNSGDSRGGSLQAFDEVEVTSDVSGAPPTVDTVAHDDEYVAQLPRVMQVRFDTNAARTHNPRQPAEGWAWDHGRNAHYYYSLADRCFIYSDGRRINSAGVELPVVDSSAPQIYNEHTSSIVPEQLAYAQPGHALVASRNSYYDATQDISSLSLGPESSEVNIGVQEIQGPTVAKFQEWPKNQITPHSLFRRGVRVHRKLYGTAGETESLDPGTAASSDVHYPR